MLLQFTQCAGSGFQLLITLLIDVSLVTASLNLILNNIWATVCKTVRPMLWSDGCLSVTLYHVPCGKTVRWITMKLGTQVGLGPSHFVLDGDPAPLPKGAQPQLGTAPVSGPYVVAKWLDGLRRHLVWRRPRSKRLCVRWEHSSPCPKGGEAPNFRPMSIVAKRLDGSRWHLVWRWAIGPGHIVLSPRSPKKGADCRAKCDLTSLLYKSITVSLDLSTKLRLIIPSILLAFLTAQVYNVWKRVGVRAPFNILHNDCLLVFPCRSAQNIWVPPYENP